MTSNERDFSWRVEMSRDGIILGLWMLFWMFSVFMVPFCWSFIGFFFVGLTSTSLTIFLAIVTYVVRRFPKETHRQYFFEKFGTEIMNPLFYGITSILLITGSLLQPMINPFLPFNSDLLIIGDNIFLLGYVFLVFSSSIRMSTEWGASSSERLDCLYGLIIKWLENESKMVEYWVKHQGKSSKEKNMFDLNPFSLLLEDISKESLHFLRQYSPLAPELDYLKGLRFLLFEYTSGNKTRILRKLKRLQTTAGNKDAEAYLKTWKTIQQEKDYEVFLARKDEYRAKRILDLGRLLIAILGITLTIIIFAFSTLILFVQTTIQIIDSFLSLFGLNSVRLIWILILMIVALLIGARTFIKGRLLVHSALLSVVQ